MFAFPPPTQNEFVRIRKKSCFTHLPKYYTVVTEILKCRLPNIFYKFIKRIDEQQYDCSSPSELKRIHQK